MGRVRFELSVTIDTETNVAARDVESSLKQLVDDITTGKLARATATKVKVNVIRSSPED